MSEQDELPEASEGVEGLLVALFERIEESDSNVDDVLAQLCDDHPEHAQELRASVRVLNSSGLLSSSSRKGSDYLPGPIGAYQPTEVLGRGGMAVVYLARHRETGDEVALKLLRPHELDSSRARARFKREIVVLSRMDHPGIAGVCDLGEEGGIPFLAMEFVPGCSLTQVLGHLIRNRIESPTGEDIEEALREHGRGLDEDTYFDGTFFAGSWTTIALRIARRVAEALQHAHERGVLHRDIKPSNVMLTPTGRVVLLDFGLATLSGADRLTRTSTELGSLPYMAPEQLEHGPAACDARTEVYQLGVTLYELLARRHPYLDPGNREGTRARIVSGRPEPLARCVSDLDADAELVIRAAMDLEPARRFATAGDLAADLSNALHGRAVHARPAGRMVLAARWLGRHRALAGAAAVLAGTLIVGPGVFAVREARAKERIDRAHQDLETTFEQAVAAIELLTRTAQDELADVPMASEARRKILEGAVKFLEELDPPAGEGGRVAATLARGRLQLATLLVLLGRDADAEPIALDLIEVLGRFDPPQLDLLVQTHGKLADAYRGLGRMDDSITQLERASALAPGASKPINQLRADVQLSVQLREAGRVDEGRRLGAAALVAIEATWDAESSGSEFAMLYTAALLSQGMLRVGAREYPAAQADFVRTEEVARGALARDQQHRGLRTQLLTSLVNRAACSFQMGEPAQAREPMEAAAEIAKDLVERYPLVPDYHRRRSAILMNLGVVRAMAGEDARESLTEQLVVQEELAERFQIKRDRWMIALTLENLAGAHSDAGEPQLELGLLERSAALCREALAELPGEFNFARCLRNVLRRRAEVLTFLERHEEALLALEELPAPWTPEERLTLARVYASSGGPARFDDAMQQLRAAVAELDGGHDQLKAMPLLAPLADHPAFQELVDSGRD